ncbi:hypothetical protein ACIQUC_00135 [Curtobacterium sp. NPDC098951]|uniref:hypothetical protein n=1 Tax=Curtobacterium sp. NPDC098951 TaxID=3363974 RepID=UPI0038232DEE
MGDLTIDASVMHSVASKAKNAAAEFGSERALSGADGGCFGSVGVASAFTTSARAQDAMVRSLGDDADTLSQFVRDAVSEMEQADAGLAARLR